MADVQMAKKALGIGSVLRLVSFGDSHFNQTSEPSPMFDPAEDTRLFPWTIADPVSVDVACVIGLATTTQQRLVFCIIMQKRQFACRSHIRMPIENHVEDCRSRSTVSRYIKNSATIGRKHVRYDLAR